MAYTSVIPVRRLDRTVDYVQNKEKTTPKSLEEAVDYAANRDKTESACFETGLGCTTTSAFEDMRLNTLRWHKETGVQGYHLVQSFAEGEVTPELAHQIGVEFAEQLLHGKYQAIVTTHLNTKHYHNHIVFNSVSMEDGKKYHSNSRSYYEDVRKASDALCLKYGLSVIEPKNVKGKSYVQWMAEQDGKPTWRTSIRLDIRDAVAESFTWKQFLDQMKQRGYQWKLNRKYIALKAPGMERYIRLRSLGKGYGEAEIREKILRPKIRQVYGNTQMQSPRRKLTGLQRLYYSYLYQMGVFPKKPKRIPYAVRSDIRRLDQRICQMEFLQKEGITTREGLIAYRKPLEEQVLSLMKERRELYRKAPGGMRIQAINGELKELRKKIRLSQQIEKQSLEMEERLRQAKAQEQEMSGKQRREIERNR